MSNALQICANEKCANENCASSGIPIFLRCCLAHIQTMKWPSDFGLAVDVRFERQSNIRDMYKIGIFINVDILHKFQHYSKHWILVGKITLASDAKQTFLRCPKRVVYRHRQWNLITTSIGRRILRQIYEFRLNLLGMSVRCCEYVRLQM